MARLYNSFEFTGDLNFTKEPYKVKKFDSGWEQHRLSLIINESDNNGVFVQIDSGIHTAKQNLVYSSAKGMFGESMSQVQIAWEDRFTESVVDTVPDFRKVIVDLTDPSVSKDEYFKLKSEIYNLETKTDATDEDKTVLKELYQKARTLLPERKEFLHKYDALKYIFEKIESLKGKKVRVKGNIVKSHYNGKFYTNYEPHSIELVSSEEPNKLKAQLDLFFTKDALDDADFKDEKILRFDTYILSYDNQHKKDVFFPQPTVLNASKLDLENPQHLGRVEFIKKIFNVKGKGVFHIPFEVKMFRGAEKEEFTEQDLNDMQKEMIELGMAKLDDFKPKGGVLGESREEVRLVKPVLKRFDDSNDFAEGVVESVFEVDDLQYVPVQTNYTPPKQEEVKESTTKSQEVEFVDLDDLL